MTMVRHDAELEVVVKSGNTVLERQRVEACSLGGALTVIGGCSWLRVAIAIMACANSMPALSADRVSSGSDEGTAAGNWYGTGIISMLPGTRPSRTIA